MSLSQTKGRMISGISNKWKTITDNHTVEYSESLIVKSNIEVTVTLPAVPSEGQWVKIVDGSGNASIAPIVIDGGNVTITGALTENQTTHTIEVDNLSASLLFDGTNWIFVASVSSSEEPGAGTRPQVITGAVDSVTGNSFTASVQVMAFGSVGAGSLLVGLRYREDGDPNWTETTPTAVSAIGTYPVTISDLDPNKTYQFQAFGRDALNPATFVVGEVRTALTDNVFVQSPSVSVEGSPDDVGETPAITVSPFSVFGGSDTYVRSEVKVFQNGVEIWSNSNVVIGSPWKWVLPAGILVEDASGYRVDVRHVGSTFGPGGWGQSAVFSTKEEFFTFDPSFAGHPFGGGFYAGANIIVGGQEYALVVAPKTQGGEPATKLQWKNADTATSGTDSLNNGLANSNAMNNTTHPAARFCRGLNINGHNDWYLPSKDELEICYRYLKPTTGSNHTSSGVNNNSNPVGTVYTTSNPVRTSISIFRQGGGESFPTDSYLWSSTQNSPGSAWRQDFGIGYQSGFNKTSAYWVRAVRRVAL